MIDGLRPYPDMKQTGLPWLGDVPAHWDVRRNGRLFGARRETGFPDLPVLEVSISRGVRVRDFDSGGRKQEMADRSKYQRAVRGDIAYNMMRMWQGAVGIAPADGLVSPAYVVARPFPETNAGYYAYLFRTAAYMRETDVFSRGIVPDRNRLYWESFKQMPSVYPPLNEQRLIVRFLDWHGAQTAKLIRAKKKLIALLNEQKQAVINRAVTRGLDAKAKFEPSGLRWLGDVPSGWKSGRLKTCVTAIQQGWSPQCDSQPAADNEWGVLKVGCVNQETFLESQNKKLPSSLVPNLHLEIEDGDILVSRANTRELLGLAALARNPRRKLILCDKLFRFRARPAIANPSFLVLALRSKPSRAQIESSTNGASSSMQNIGQDVIRNLWICLPSVDARR